jgi:hypothetical protein
MDRFDSLAHLQGSVLNLTDDDFFGYQHFLFGCCDWLKGFIEWPKVKEAYEKFKLGLGNRSLFMKPPGWRDFRAFTLPERKKAQWVIYNLLSDLQEWQDMTNLSWRTHPHLRGLMKYVPKIQLWDIWKDTVLTKPKYEPRYPLEIRRLGFQIRSESKYSEIGVLGDMCDDFGFTDEAAHFHDPTCLHTYACRYLHIVCKGMDGR